MGYGKHLAVIRFPLPVPSRENQRFPPGNRSMERNRQRGIRGHHLGTQAYRTKAKGRKRVLLYSSSFIHYSRKV